jgi:uncharacterized delta-60 repeat protein
VDNSFQSGISPTKGMVSSVALQRDGKILIAGGACQQFFSSSLCFSSVSRLNADGTLDRGFQVELSGFGQWISSIAVQNDGRVLVGGSFSTINEVNRNSIARFNADGTLDSGFQNGLSGANGSIRAVAVQGDGKILVAGNFSVINGVPAAGIARLWGSADIPPRFKSLNRSGAQVELRWDALPNRTYRVQYKDDLAAPWTDLDGHVSGSLTGTATKTDATIGSVSQRFYRVELLP